MRKVINDVSRMHNTGKTPTTTPEDQSLRHEWNVGQHKVSWTDRCWSHECMYTYLMYRKWKRKNLLTRCTSCIVIDECRPFICGEGIAEDYLWTNHTIRGTLRQRNGKFHISVLCADWKTSGAPPLRCRFGLYNLLVGCTLFFCCFVFNLSWLKSEIRRQSAVLSSKLDVDLRCKRWDSRWYIFL